MHALRMRRQVLIATGPIHPRMHPEGATGGMNTYGDDDPAELGEPDDHEPLTDPHSPAKLDNPHRYDWMPTRSDPASHRPAKSRTSYDDRRLTFIAEAIPDILRDHEITKRMLDIQRVGYLPASGTPTIDESPHREYDHDDNNPDHATAIGYSDPTGELAIRPDPAGIDLATYQRFITMLFKATVGADLIRRKNLPTQVDRKSLANPPGLCRNCLSHGVRKDVADKRYAHCGFCRSVHAAHGFYPHQSACELNDAGQSVQAARLIIDLARKRKARGRKAAS
jgi:hypothetical protein